MESDVGYRISKAQVSDRVVYTAWAPVAKANRRRPRFVALVYTPNFDEARQACEENHRGSFHELGQREYATPRSSTAFRGPLVSAAVRNSEAYGTEEGRVGDLDGNSGRK